MGVTEAESSPALDGVYFGDSDDSVILFDWEDAAVEKFRNLVRVSASGEIVWRAELPHDPELTGGFDAYDSVAWDKGRLIANSLSCFRVELAPEDGRIVAAEFTK
jgi:hypothetical protein